MKKTVWLLAAIITALSFTGCGGSGSTTITKSETKEERTLVAEEEKTTEPEIKAADTEPETSAETFAEMTQESSTEAQTQAESAFEKIVAVDNDECKITIKGLDPDSTWGYAVKVELENKSADKTYMFSADDASINGVMYDPLFASEVAPGKKANASIDFSLTDLKKNGIGDVTDIEIGFRVYDSNNWSADNVAKESIHIYPLGEDKATVYVREPKDTDNVIMDNDYVTVTQIGVDKGSVWGYSLELYIVNKSDKNIMVSEDEASVNGYMADPLFATEVVAGKSKFASMSWLDSTLKENEIENVESIEFILKAYDSDNWHEYAKDKITITPQQ